MLEISRLLLKDKDQLERQNFYLWSDLIQLQTASFSESGRLSMLYGVSLPHCLVKITPDADTPSVDYLIL